MKKWISSYKYTVASMSQNVFKTFFEIVENSVEDKEILKLIHDKKLSILDNESQISRTFVDNIFERYLQEKTIFMKYGHNIDLMRKVTLQGFAEGIRKYKKTLVTIKS